MTMADVINAKDNGGGGFKPHPEGQFGAVCVDVIDLGERLKTWGDKPKVAQMCALVFMTGEQNEETGHLHDVHQEFTVSMFESANLRLFLEAWRGRSYTEEQAKDGVPLHKLVGQPALISVTHKASKKGRTYATIQSIMPLPKGMVAPSVDPEQYERASFWADRKKGYADELATFRSRTAPAADEYAGVPANGVDDISNLPF
jgi:hypothetical protein